MRILPTGSSKRDEGAEPLSETGKSTRDTSNSSWGSTECASFSTHVLDEED